MRYRPFGRSGAAISNLTVSLDYDALARGPEAARDLIHAALDAGINSYRLASADPVLAEVTGQALAHVERELVCVSLALGQGHGRRGPGRDFSAEALTADIDRVLHVSGLGWIDVAMLDGPGEDELPQASLTALKGLRSTGRVRFLGISGGGEVMDAYVSTGAFDVLSTPFHVNVDWRIRARLRAAREQDMGVFAYDYFPEGLLDPRRAAGAEAPRKGLFGLGGRSRPSGPAPESGAFAFLGRTPHWDAEAICLAYALTEPSISSVIVRAASRDRLAMLAETPERDLPPGLAAQIEMARVSSAAA